MKKRLMSILICVLLLVMVIPGIANAEGNEPALSTTATYTDQQFRILEKKVDVANAKIEKAVEKAQTTPWDDVDELLATVDGIVAGVMDYAASICATARGGKERT